ncbi:fimbria/pilus outer membrane usher protein [Acinetobacter nectaris]|uniref:fimbria/pilus outer membrane usher protein n=1 Tax=Acinetobacter nectaris TaxID=1219382 RepID=UPI0023519F46|nr:fimbria/pilus outer membrane usher protein [Acinetobacter nectaris]
MSNCKIIFIIVVLFSTNTYIYAEKNPQEADFDTNFLMGNTKNNIDISRFKYRNPILPSIYNLDVYVNNKWVGKQNFDFKSTVKQDNATTCFTLHTLLNYHVKYSALEHLINQNSLMCAPLSEWIPNAYYDFDTSTQRLDIFIPQIAMETKVRDYVDPNSWDHGINAGFLSYNANAYQIRNNITKQNTNTNAFISLSAGLNINEWQLRHNGQWQWSNSNSASYTPINTYLQKAIPKYQSVFTLGDNFTSGNIFNSIGYRGIDFSNDDRMLPNSMQGYAPQIHGVAKTNAKVEIRQRGQLIYQTMVSPGAFEINDLYPTGFGGTLDVAVFESDGYIQRYSVPYSSSVQMLRPKRKKFSLTLGQVREKTLNSKPLFSQGVFQYGLNNYFTTSSGIQLSNDYYALSLGGAVSTQLGAVSVDITHNRNSLINRQHSSGNTLNLTYNRVVEPTNTQISISASQKLSGNYYTLKDTIALKEYAQHMPYLTANSLGGQENQLQVNLNQVLPKKFGSFYLTGLWVNYSGNQPSNKEYQFGYNNTYRGLNYSISITSQQLQYASQKLGHNTEYLFTLSFPLSFKKYSFNTNASFSQDNQNLGISGTVGDRLSYSAILAKQFDQNSISLNTDYKSDMTTIGTSYTQSDSYKQTMLNLSGNIVLHSHGILFSPEQGQTMGIVYAPDATGASINSNPNILINKYGYALIPYLNPYRLNDIYIDPENMSNRVELKETSHRIAPYAGSITKIVFSTQKGYAIYIHSRMPNGQPLPFAAQVYNSKGEIIGMVAQGSLVYARTPLIDDILKIKWGEKTTDQCAIHYSLKHQVENNQLNMFMVEAACQ